MKAEIVDWVSVLNAIEYEPRPILELMEAHPSKQRGYHAATLLFPGSRCSVTHSCPMELVGALAEECDHAWDALLLEIHA